MTDSRTVVIADVRRALEAEADRVERVASAFPELYSDPAGYAYRMRMRASLMLDTGGDES